MKHKDLEEQRDDFAKWLDQWDKVSEQFAKDYADQLAAAPKKSSSFFTDIPLDVDPTQESDPSWNDIYARAVELDYSQENLITEIDQDSTGDSGEVKFGGRPPTKSNPIHYASAGNDQEGDDGHTRVTKNFSDGNELRELDDIRRRLEEMERKFHADDVLAKKTESIKKELNSLRERAKKLSQEINSEPLNDVT